MNKMHHCLLRVTMETNTIVLMREIWHLYLEIWAKVKSFLKLSHLYRIPLWRWCTFGWGCYQNSCRKSVQCCQQDSKECVWIDHFCKKKRYGANLIFFIMRKVWYISSNLNSKLLSVRPNVQLHQFKLEFLRKYMVR